MAAYERTSQKILAFTSAQRIPEQPSKLRKYSIKGRTVRAHRKGFVVAIRTLQILREGSLQ